MLLPPCLSSPDAHTRCLPVVLQIQALKNMGYNISRAKLSEDSANKFFITDARTAEKVTQSAELESIRQCIIHNMMDYHPESKELYSTGAQMVVCAVHCAVLGMLRGAVQHTVRRAAASRCSWQYGNASLAVTCTMHCACISGSVSMNASTFAGAEELPGKDKILGLDSKPGEVCAVATFMHSCCRWHSSSLTAAHSGVVHAHAQSALAL